MANSNVRFYRLETLPSFEAKHKGIFVHVTKTMGNKKWAEINDSSFNPEKILITTIKNINLEQWLSERRIDSIESGLWFGGENGWELLSNETNSIDATINAKIAALDVEGYVQAEMSNNGTDSTLTIKGIQEVDGKIGIPADSENLDFDIAIDGVYSQSNKIATESTVTTAINGLDVNAIQAVTFNTPENGGNTTLTFKGIKEVDGKIAQGDEQNPDTFIVGDAKLKIQIGSAEASAFEVFSANKQSDSTIKLDGYVFKKDENNVISVIAQTAVSESNKLVTQQDIANISGAMHYKGALTGAQSGAGSWPSTVAAGDVYIVTTSFTHSGESNPFEVGDMIVFNSTSASDYKVIQSNITLGTGIGQVAANSDVLVDGNLVVATDNGIKTTGISATVLEASNNTRDLTYSNVTGGISITDSLKIMNRDFNESINITSTNRSIKIAANASENATNVVLDLVWNTIME